MLKRLERFQQRLDTAEAFLRGAVRAALILGAMGLGVAFIIALFITLIFGGDPTAQFAQ